MNTAALTTTFATKLRNCLVIALCFLFVITPLSPIIIQKVQAADPSATPLNTTSKLVRCGINNGPNTSSVADSEDDDTDGSGAPTTFLEESDPLFVKAPLQDVVRKLLDQYGEYDSTNKGWTVCTSDLNTFFSFIPFGQSTYQYFDTLVNQEKKIDFKYPETDYAAFFGEPCERFNDGKCDQTKILVDKDDKPIQKDGKDQTVVETCPNGQATYGVKYGDTQADGTRSIVEKYKPLYFTDQPWPNGCWDAPKANVRILKMLTYLVTPIEEGGAGREYIKVGRILQDSKTSKTEFSQDSLQEENDKTVSAHWYDESNPSHPGTISQAVDIVEIDKMRVTTEIIKKRRVGSIKTYKYQSFPIKVAWQTNEGIAKSGGLPAVNMYQSGQDAVNASILDLLDEYGFNEDGEDIDMQNVSLSNLGSIANFLGEQMINQIMGGTGGNLDANDLDKTLENLGRAYLANQLGLPAGSLSEGNTPDEITANIGRVSTEKNFGFPRSSLKGRTSDEIFTNIGRRFLEAVVFNVSENTLDSNAGITSQDILIKRLGEGTIERRFRLVPQLTKDRELSEVKERSAKARILFASDNKKTEEYQYIDEALNLSYVPQEGDSPISTYGFTEADFAHPTEDLLKSPNNKQAWDKYKKLVGVRVIQTGIGAFTSSTAAKRLATNDSNFLPYVMEQFGAEITQDRPGTSPATLDGYLAKIKDSQNYKDIIGLTIKNPDGTETKPFTEETILPLLRDVVQKQLSGAYNLSSQNDDSTQNSAAFNAKLVEIYNDINSENPAGWRERFQSLLDMANLYVSSSGKTDDNGVTNTQASKVSDLFTGVLTKISQFNDAVLNLQDQYQQSGMGAVLNLPTNVWQTSGNSTQTGVFASQQDVISAILHGNFGVLPLLGKLYAVTLISQDKATQRSLLAEILSDPQMKIFDNLQKSGVTKTNLLEKGLSEDDFRRIFRDGLSTEVFQKIGKEQLLASLWDSVKDTSGVSDITQKAEDAYATFDFYKERKDRIQEINNKIVNIVKDYCGKNPCNTDDSRKALSSLSDGLYKLDINKQDSITDIISSGEKVGQVINAYYAIIDPSQEPGNRVMPLVEEEMRLIQEIFGGKPLDFSSSSNTSSQNHDKDCVSAATIRNFLKKQGLNFKNVVTEIAACRLDSSLDLPEGSVYLWYSGSDHTVKGLEYAVGTAYARNHQQTFTSDEARRRGADILKSRLLITFGEKIPGFKQFADKYNITAEDIALLLNGSSDDFIRKVGASMLDSYFKWPAGTSDQLIKPTCRGSDNKPRQCSKVEAENVRFRVMAQLGLNMLGVSLDFPETFDITQGGNFIANYGVAAVSEYMGLSNNTFRGTFANTLSLNTRDVMITALRADNFPLINKVYTLRDELSSTTTKNPGARDDLVNNYIKPYLDKVYQKQLTDMQTTTSAYWNIPNEAQATALLKNDLHDYSQLLKDLSYRVTASFSVYGESRFSEIVNKYLSEYNDNLEDDTYWGNTYAKQQINGYQTFRNRLDELDTHFQVDQSKNPVAGPKDWGRFERWVLGSSVNPYEVSADDISKDVGKIDLGAHLADDFINSHIPDDSPIKVLLSTLHELSKTPECPDGTTVAKLIVGPTNPACKLSGLGDLNFNNLLNDDPNDPNSKFSAQQRKFLFDTFLGSVFSTKLEDDLGFERGTFRAMVVHPAMAQDILTEQGLLIVARKLFGSNPGDSDGERALKESLYDAFLAGFYDPEKETYSLKFDKARSLDKLREQTGLVISRLLKEYNSKYFGNSVSVSDINLMLSGDLNAITYLGIMSQIVQINKKLSDDTHTGASYFVINYNLVRGATAKLTQHSLDEATAQIMRQEYCVKDKVISDETCKEKDTAKFLDKATAEEPGNRVAAETFARENFQNNKKRSQEILIYSVMDAMAFKMDSSIPPGFSYAMLKGGSADKLRALGMYAIGKLKEGGIDIPFGPDQIDMLTSLINYSSCLITQGNNASSCGIPGGNQKLLSDAIYKLDLWATNNWEQWIGFKLPEGVVKGFFAWGSTGFNNDAFDSNNLTFLGEKNVASIGFIIKDAAIQNLMGWVDRRLGMQAGSAYQIYEGYTKYRNAYNAYHAAISNAVPIGKDATGKAIYSKEDGDKIDQAGKQMKQAEAAVITLAITLAFSSQISDMETSIGLVPGTGGMVVGMMVNLLMNVPISPWTIGAFVVINLIGVYKVQVNVRATGDGYYPIKQKGDEEIHYTQDPLLGDFNAQVQSSYQQGAMLAAQNKVRELLRDTLLMVGGDNNQKVGWDAITGSDPETLHISQAFTNRAEDIAALEPLIGRQAPWDNPPGWGYGSLKERLATSNFSKVANAILLGVPADGYNAGYFSGSEFWGHIHFRW